ncbi:MAG TPA: amidohydrolase family protein [Devosia sp.]|nr:amidohydrolase family protein [Devosia sp.]
MTDREHSRRPIPSFGNAYVPQAAPPFRGNYYRMIPEARAWQGPFTEEIIDPDLPIVDAHHHLQEDAKGRYLLHESVADMATGHNFIATVHVQAKSMLRAEGPAHLKDVGETEFARGMAAMAATGLYGGARVCEGIVGCVDFRLEPKLVAEALEAHIEAAGGRFRGIRQIAPHVDGELAKSMPLNVAEGLLRDAAFQRGFAELAQRNLSFDAWLFHPQLGDVAELADAFPDTTIILNHLGGRLGIGPFATRFEDEFSNWRAGLADLAKRPNIFVKIGGLGMLYGGFDFHTRAEAPTSELLERAWGPFIRLGIDIFGPDRAMMESNFPIDNQSAAFPVTWNTLKRATSEYSVEERAQLFHRTAQKAYRLRETIEGVPKL